MNKDLYNKIIHLPKEILEYLEVCFNHIPNSNANVEGHNRNQELRSNGYATYQQLGRIKNWFDNFNGKRDDAPYILNGSDYMRNWTNQTLDSMRSSDGLTKQIRKDNSPEPIDKNLTKNMGWLADFSNPSDEHSDFVSDITLSEDLKRINNLIKKII